MNKCNGIVINILEYFRLRIKWSSFVANTYTQYNIHIPPNLYIIYADTTIYVYMICMYVYVYVYK